jgi:hypothetical protein
LKCSILFLVLLARPINSCDKGIEQPLVSFLRVKNDCSCLILGVGKFQRVCNLGSSASETICVLESIFMIVLIHS